MECTFQVGDRVVFVGGTRAACAHCQAVYKSRRAAMGKGDIFTVSKVWPSPTRICRHGTHIQSYVAIDLSERPSVVPESGYYAGIFRPVKPLSFWLGEKQDMRVPA